MVLGLKVNLGKSFIFYSINIAVNQHQGISQLLHMKRTNDGSMYMRLPLTMGRNKNVVLGYLNNHIQKSLQGWDTKLILKLGKKYY